MKLITQTPKQSLNKAFLKQRPVRSEIETFKNNLKILLSKVQAKESEENKKNHVRDFLLDTYYKGICEVNTKDRKDLVIHLDKTNESNVGVIVEAKSPDNKAEMLKTDKANTKALQELVLYYFDERQAKGNVELKNLVVTNAYEWFIFDANVFDKKIYRNTQIRKLYETKISDKKDNPFFYEELRKIFDNLDEELACTYFNLKEYETILNNADLEDDKELIALFKIVSPTHLLKLAFADDSNSLNKPFYDELLHIIGLEEVKIKSKSIIRRKEEGNRNAASLLENAITILKTKDSLRRVKNIADYGAASEEKYFNVALELCIVWINRILFLKLLESQLVNYHKGNRDYKFLKIKTIPDFDELFTLFHQVLAKTFADREDNIREKYKRVPYLNSSLFEISELEDLTISIESLKDTAHLPFINSTILKRQKAENQSFGTLEYLFKFLDAYDFASEGAEDVQEDNRSLINASVLGKVFEKINGYKDGSIFTPGFITMYMCRQAIRLAVVQKFKDQYELDIDGFDELRNFTKNTYKTEQIREYNALVNSLHLCDPAVGSGHFLVSSLNEIIAIKSELGLLADDGGVRLSEYQITIENDELIITDENGDIFEYQINENGKPTAKAQRLQKTLFHEKQTLIENCLFGVDINPNSVKICRLRLWIELLKNAYYKESGNFAELETLPNIDINIKEGNSLVSRFPLDDDLKQILKKIKYSIEDYRNFVLGYKETRNREKKREFEAKIKQIKEDFRVELNHFSPVRVKLAKLENELFENQSKTFLFGEDEDKKAKRLKKIEELKFDVDEQKQKVKESEENVIYKNAFEWRFEFPEVLDNDGNFTGFDIVIGNPPYFSISKNQELKQVQDRYETFDSTGDIYCLFYEKGHQLSKQNGLLSYITSNKWLRSNYGENLRQYLLDKTNLLFLFDFAWYQVFDNAAVDSNILTFINHSNTDSFYGTVAKPDFDITEFEKYAAENKQKLHFADNSYWSIIDDKSIALNKKLSDNGKAISQWELKINYGIKTGLNEAFIIDEETKNELISQDSKNEQIIKPLLRGQDIRKFGFEFKKLWLINSHNGIREKKIPAINIEKDYPTIYKHLLNFKDKAIARTDKGDHWTNLRNCAYGEEFQKEKLVWAETMRVHRTDENNFPRFGYDNQEFFTDKTVFIGIGISIKYLLSILNSSVGRYLVKNYVDKLDTGGYMMQKSSIEKIPIKKIEEKAQQPFVALVDQILELKKAGKDTQALENEIDALVYRLYDLTDEEIRIVEGKEK